MPSDDLAVLRALPVLRFISSACFTRFKDLESQLGGISPAFRLALSRLVCEDDYL